MRTGFFPPRPKLSLAQQYLLLKRDFPDGTGEIGGGRIIWRQPIQPTPISRGYQLRLCYTLTASPKTTIERPCLVELANNKRIPHLYKQDPAQLCLYQPAYREWSPERLLSKTVIPWAVLWLFYFEDWLSSGEWKGGGEHPDPGNN